MSLSALTWHLLRPGDHVDQLLVGHAGEQGHDGDLGVRPTELLAGTQDWRLRLLQQQQHLGKGGVITILQALYNPDMTVL